MRSRSEISAGLRGLGGALALLLALAGARPAAAVTVLGFGGGSPPGSFADVVPGGAYGPTLVYGDVTVRGGVRLTNFQPREDRLDGEVYATSDFSPLADDSLLPGTLTLDFAEPVRAARLSVQDWFLAASFRIDAYDAADTLLASDSVSLDDFGVDPDDAGRLTVLRPALEGEISRVVVHSLQSPGEVDFAIDNVIYEAGATPIFTNDSPAEAVAIEAGQPITGSSHFVTAQGDEPLCDCGTPIDSAPVWLRFQTPLAGTYSFDTSGSSYDTVASVWLDPGGGAVPTIQVACDDDGGAANASFLVFEAQAEVDYLLLVSEYAGDVGGILETVLLPEPRAGTGAGAALLALVWSARRRRLAERPEMPGEPARSAI